MKTAREFLMKEYQVGEEKNCFLVPAAALIDYVPNFVVVDKRALTFSSSNSLIINLY